MKQFDIPVIQNDLRHEEMIVQAINVFEHLENVVNTVFDKLDSSIELRLKKIDELKVRIARANDKIDSFKGVKKSISIFSPAKYPAADNYTKIQSTFSDLDPEKVQLNRDYKIEHSFDHLERTLRADKLKFYHVRKHIKPSVASPTNNLAFRMKSVNSSIIFNTNENVLVKDGSSKVSQSTKVKADVDHPEIDITDFSKLTTKIRPLEKGIGYSPGMKNAPQIEVPVDLPDLPGIADDIQYSQLDLDSSIAPSLASMQIIGDLPIPELPEIKEVSEIKSVESGSVQPVVSQAPAPPPPPPEVFIKASNPPASAVPPPPPPPMPMALPIPQPPKSAEIASKPAENKIPVASSDDARSNLMQAIRNAAGRTLKRAGADIKPATDKKEDKKPISQAPAGNLMADLHRKLMMRREGISGANNATQEGKPGNVLSSLASVIPPPPKRQGVSSEEDSDNGDWE